MKVEESAMTGTANDMTTYVGGIAWPSIQ